MAHGRKHGNDQLAYACRIPVCENGDDSREEGGRTVPRPCLQGAFRLQPLGLGKTRAQCGGNMADVMIMFSSFLGAQYLWRTRMFLETFRNICVCAARNNVAPPVLPRTGNIAGHNVAATMCPRFAETLHNMITNFSCHAQTWLTLYERHWVRTNFGCILNAPSLIMSHAFAPTFEAKLTVQELGVPGSVNSTMIQL